MFWFQKITKQTGQTLAEVVIAMAVFSLIALTVSTMFLDSFTALSVSAEIAEANVYAQEGIDAVESIRDDNWFALENGVYGLTTQQGYWEFSGTTDSWEEKTRRIIVEDVERNSAGDVVLSGGTIDPRTKKITSTVTWPSRGGARTVVLVTYLTDWNSYDWHETTDSEFGEGAVNDTRITGGGESASIVLADGASQGSIVSFDRWIPGGGRTLIHTNDVDFDSGISTNLQRIGIADPAKLALNQSVQWSAFEGTGEVVSAMMLNDIDLLSEDFGYAVGRQGTIIKWDGVSWQSVTSPTNTGLNAIHIVSETDIWVVGDGGEIIHWNGFVWSNVASPTTKELRDVFMVNANDGWITTKGGQILHWNGAVWNIVSSPTSRDLEEVTCLAVDFCMAVGSSGTIIEWDGVSWTEMESNTNKSLYGLDILNESYAWAVGQQGEVVFWNGIDWTPSDSPATRELHTVIAWDENYAIAVGGNGVGQGEVVTWDGLEWTEVAFEDRPNGLNGFDLIAADNGQAVGGLPNEEVILKYNGSDWREITSEASSFLIYDMDMYGEDYGVAVGSSGKILDFDGTDWLEIGSPTGQNIYAVDVVDENHVWIAGRRGDIFFWDGTTWVEQNSPSTSDWNAIYMLSANEGWLVGDSGHVAYWNGSVWSEEDAGSGGFFDFFSSFTGNDLFDVHFVSSDAGWAVGESGDVFHWDGSDWIEQSINTWEDLNGVYMLTVNDGWAVGDRGVIYHWDGTQWSESVSPTSDDLEGVHFIHGGDGWVSGENGTLLHWDGITWEEVTSPTSKDLYDVFMVASTDIWGMGESTTIIHYQNAYEPYGEWLSPVIDSGDPATPWDYISWLEDITASGTDITLDTRTGNTPTPDASWSGFVGSYSNPAGEQIVSPSGQYMQYRVIFETTNQRFSPQLLEVIINYDNPTSQNLQALYLNDVDYGMALANLGNISSYDGIAWGLEASPMNQNLYGIDGIASTDIWGVGENGTMIHWDGSLWSEVATGTNNRLNDVGMVSSTDVWAVGAGDTILHWDGTVWSEVPVAFGMDIEAIDVVNASNIWAVGNGGNMIHWDGTNWTQVNTPTTNTLHDIFMVTASDGWAVGDNGTILRWDGLTWTAELSPTMSSLRSVFLAEENDGWIVGANGTILQYEGISWAAFTSPVVENLNDVFLATPHDGWMIGDGGLFLHLDSADIEIEGSGEIEIVTGSFVDDEQVEFDAGTYLDTVWDTDHVGLTAAGLTVGEGVYTSRVFDSVSTGTQWDAISGEAFITGDSGLRMEVDSALVGNDFVTIPLQQEYEHPVVIGLYYESANSSPASIRVANVTSTSFDMRLQAPDGSVMVGDTVHYMVVEEGAWTLPDGTKIEAHTWDTNNTSSWYTSWDGDQITYDYVYDTPPAVFHQIQTYNSSNWIETWVSEIGAKAQPPTETQMMGALNGAEVYSSHILETIGWVAIEEGTGTIGDITFEAFQTADFVQGESNGDGCFEQVFTNGYVQAPIVIADQTAMGGGNGSWGFACSLNSVEVGLRAQEDTVNDTEVTHVAEPFAYAAFSEPFVLQPMEIKVQVRSCDDELCQGESFVGPDGTDQTYFSSQGGEAVNVSNNRYFQYQVGFVSDGVGGTPELTRVQIDYTMVTGGGGNFVNSGEFISQVFDSEDPLTSWQGLYWSELLLPGTNVELWVRTGNTYPPDASWGAWQGPYSDPLGEELYGLEGRYAQYRVTLTSSGSETPLVEDVTITYR